MKWIAMTIFWWIIEHKCKPKKLFLEAYTYDDCFENEESTYKEESVDLSDMLLLEGDEDF